jgi:hypothetical protein
MAVSINPAPSIKSDTLAAESASLQFSLTEGGPGFAWLKRLRLIHPEMGTGSLRAAVVLMAVTWIPLFVLCLIEGLAFGGVKIPFMFDIAAHTRFLIAVPVLVLAEIPIGVRQRDVVTHFLAAHLIREDELPKFRDDLSDALRFRDSRLAEMIVLGLAYLSTYAALRSLVTQGGSTWFRPVPGQSLTVVGYWYAFVALPIFSFLMIRWAFRMLVWSRLLWKFSRLRLLITPTHPDQAGGLAFVGKGLIPFGVILFALSAVVSSGIGSRIIFGAGRLEDFQWSYIALFIVLLVVFAGPILIFVPKLIALKQRGMLEYGILGSEYTQAFHRKWIEHAPPSGSEMLGSGDFQSLADLSNAFEVVRKMRILPLEPSDFIAMAIPGLIPALPLLLTVMPLGEIFSRLLKLIL